jgi:hypothetical protein
MLPWHPTEGGGGRARVEGWTTSAHDVGRVLMNVGRVQTNAGLITFLNSLNLLNYWPLKFFSNPPYSKRLLSHFFGGRLVLHYFLIFHFSFSKYL